MVSTASSAPRLALVLGSGGVRSIAGLGIADVLEQAGLRPDVIAGCSSGALFGALVASGMPGRQALHQAKALWSRDLTSQRRWRAYAQLIAPGLTGFGGDFALRDDRLIAMRVRKAFGERRVEDLPTPLRIAATDAATGRSVVLTRGSLTDALRASIALPMMFPSVEFEGRRLVDGVISDPLPLSAVRDAQIVVALGLTGAMPRSIDRPSRLMAQASTALFNNLMQAHIDAARAAERPVIFLDLQLDRRIGVWDTSAFADLYDAGIRAMQARLQELCALLRRTACPDACAREAA